MRVNNEKCLLWQWGSSVTSPWSWSWGRLGRKGPSDGRADSSLHCRRALQSISYHATVIELFICFVLPFPLVWGRPSDPQEFPARFDFPISSASSGVRFWWMSLTLGRPPRSPPLSPPPKFIRRCPTAPRDVWCGAQGECLSPSPLAGRHQEGRRRTWRVLQTRGTDLKSSRQTNFPWKST